MAAPEDTPPSPTGPPPTASDLDIGALYARLQRETRLSGNAGWAGDDGDAAFARVRALAERYAAVRAERPLERRPGLKGALAYSVKRMLRPLLRWYVEPLAYGQRMFNDAALQLIDSLHARRLAHESARDAFALESTPRGRTASGEERQNAYSEDFRDAAPVLDIAERLAVEQSDPVTYLESLADGSLGGIFMAQVADYMPVPVLLRTLELCAQKLRPGGVLIAETINPLSPLALRNHFADLTHALPLVPETLALLARQAGFASVDTRFLNPPPRPDGMSGVVADILFAPLEYTLVART
jgi:hypothetical protein